MKCSVALLVVALSSASAFVQNGRATVGIKVAPRLASKVQSNVEMSFMPKLPKLNIPQVSKTALFSAAGAADNSLAKRIKVGSLFGLWYALNIGYNIYNKKALITAPSLTYFIAWAQLALGLLYVLPIWFLGLRKAPELTTEEIKTLTPMALFHMLTHIGAVVSLGAGAVSFTHIVKASEPAVSAAMSALFLNSYLPLPVYLSLVPVMGGVAWASLTELTFTWLGFWSAMISNVASAARGIVGKKSMTKPIGKNMNAVNLYAVMTILSTILLLPITLAVEGKTLVSSLKAVADAGKMNTLATQTLLSAVFYYLYNEVAFLALDNVAPVTHALGNTIKRVVIILTSVIVFGTKMTTQGAIGSSIAILGVLLYSLAKDYFK
jgi:solute carrier family 35, member E1